MGMDCCMRRECVNNECAPQQTPSAIKESCVYTCLALSQPPPLRAEQQIFQLKNLSSSRICAPVYQKGCTLFLFLKITAQHARATHFLIKVHFFHFEVSH
jgi:hypothetical protein